MEQYANGDCGEGDRGDVHQQRKCEGENEPERVLHPARATMETALPR